MPLLAIPESATEVVETLTELPATWMSVPTAGGLVVKLEPEAPNPATPVPVGGRIVTAGGGVVVLLLELVLLELLVLGLLVLGLLVLGLLALGPLLALVLRDAPPPPPPPQAANANRQTEAERCLYDAPIKSPLM
jgi:hypothetical protein